MPSWFISNILKKIRAWGRKAFMSVSAKLLLIAESVTRGEPANAMLFSLLMPSASENWARNRI